METGAPGRIGDPVTVIHTNRIGLVSAALGSKVHVLGHQLALRAKSKLITGIVSTVHVQVSLYVVGKSEMNISNSVTRGYF